MEDPSYREQAPSSELDQRELYLKERFGNMDPKAISRFSRKHPGDNDLLEYLTRYATAEFKEELIRVVPYQDKPTNGHKKR